MVPAGMPELSTREDIMYLRDMIYQDTETEEMKKTLRSEIDKGLNNWVKRMDNMFRKFYYFMCSSFVWCQLFNNTNDF